jgi:predicted nucleotidyltransferase
MNSKTVQSMAGFDRAHVCIPAPVSNPDIFRHDATAVILHLLFDNPERQFTNRELHRLTGKGLGNVNAAVQDLESLGVVRIDRTGRANQVQLDSSKVCSPDEPVLMIPQPEYHEPVRTIITEVCDRVGDDAGIVLFGSVARGDADRLSDIDVFVVVEGDRMAAQRAAHSIEDDIASERFDGERFEPHIVVETPESAASHDQIREVLTEGITLRANSALEAVKAEVFSNGA